MALAPRTAQNMPDCLSCVPMIVLHRLRALRNRQTISAGETWDSKPSWTSLSTVLNVKASNRQTSGVE